MHGFLCTGLALVRHRDLGTMPASARIKMTAFSTAWDAVLAQGGLGTAASVPLPTDGPIYQLLQATRQVVVICTSPHQDFTALLAEVLEAGALGPLLQVFDWLQQQPCTDLHSAEPDKLSGLHWYLVMKAITALLDQALSGKGQEGLSSELGQTCVHELEKLAGRRFFLCASVWHWCCGDN